LCFSVHAGDKCTKKDLTLVVAIGTSDLFDVALTMNDGQMFPIADLGYGLSQVLPVLVQCSFAPSKCTLLFEQPELHLHPIAARKLSKVFIDTAKDRKVHQLIETHSPDLIKAFFRAVLDGALPAEHFVAYKVQRIDGKTAIEPVEITKDGIYSNWEKDFNCE